MLLQLTDKRYVPFARSCDNLALAIAKHNGIGPAAPMGRKGIPSWSRPER